MQTKLEDFESRNVSVLAISSNPEEELREKMLPKGLTFPLLADPGLMAIDAYGLRHEGGNPITGGDIARPAVFLVDESGKIVEALLPGNWRVRSQPEHILEKWSIHDSKRKSG